MAYSVHLAQFEGPLDLLLHLISEAELDIKDIFVSEITAQYLSYMDEVDALDMDKASEFLSMAATLLYIKSRQLLPKPPAESEEGEDPEAMLIRQLRDYQAFKKAGEEFKTLFDRAARSMTRLPEDVLLPPPQVELDGATLDALMLAFAELMRRGETEQKLDHTQRVRSDRYTVRAQIRKIREALACGSALLFTDLFAADADRLERIVTLMALLEMLLHGEVHIRQGVPFAPITVSAKALLGDEESEYDYLDDESE